MSIGREVFSVRSKLAKDVARPKAAEPKVIHVDVHELHRRWRPSNPSEFARLSEDSTLIWVEDGFEFPDGREAWP